MNRYFIGIGILASLMFASCENKENLVTDNEVHFAIDEVVTRVVTSNNVTSFVKGDEIAITSTGLRKDIKDEVYTVGESGLVGPVVYYGKNEATASFVAHYPADLTTADDGSITMTVGADQTDTEKFHDNMFMVATASSNSASPAVTFKFKHQLSMVKIRLDAINDATGVTVNNVIPEVKWTVDGPVTATAAPISINTFKQASTTEDIQEYWVILPAQTVETGTKFITIQAADTQYEYTLGSDLDMSVAKVKTITLSKQGSRIEATFALDDVEWTDDDEYIDEEVTEVEKPKEPAIELISADQGDFTKVTLNEPVTNAANISDADCWTPIVTTSKIKVTEEVEGVQQEKEVTVNRGEISIDSNEGAAKIVCNGKTTGTGWYNLALVYKTSRTTESGKKFNITFECKATEGAAGIYIRVIQPEVQPSNSNIGWASNFKVTPTSFGEYEQCSHTFEILETPTISNSPATAPTLDSGLLILFGMNQTEDATYYIKNVKVTEIVED